MNLIEIIPAHSREHRKVIRAMTRGAIPVNPIAMAMIEIACAAVAASLIGLFGALFVRWWLFV